MTPHAAHCLQDANAEKPVSTMTPAQRIGFTNSKHGPQLLQAPKEGLCREAALVHCHWSAGPSNQWGSRGTGSCPDCCAHP